MVRVGLDCGDLFDFKCLVWCVGIGVFGLVCWVLIQDCFNDFVWMMRACALFYLLFDVGQCWVGWVWWFRGWVLFCG